MQFGMKREFKPGKCLEEKHSRQKEQQTSGGGNLLCGLMERQEASILESSKDRESRESCSPRHEAGD